MYVLRNSCFLQRSYITMDPRGDDLLLDDDEESAKDMAPEEEKTET